MAEVNPSNKNALKIINAVIDAMIKLLGAVPTRYFLREISGMKYDQGRVVEFKGDEKEKITALVVRFQQHMGNVALIAVNEEIKPIIKADKEALKLLPDSLIYFLEKEHELSKALAKKLITK